MSCENNCACCCCTEVGAPPISASGPAICTAIDTTTGTQDTANAIITNGACIIAGFFGAQTKQKATAVKAQTQIATTKQWTTTLMLLGVLAAFVFLFMSRPRG